MQLRYVVKSVKVKRKIKCGVIVKKIFILQTNRKGIYEDHF